MQTFLPHDNYEQTASCLDKLRLGKQRVECLQILKACLFQTGWKNHPTVRMWKDSLGSFVEYIEAICNEWTCRGYRDTVLDQVYLIVSDCRLINDKPNWLGDQRLHASHRSNLLRKYPTFYRQFGWTESDNLPYYWPK